VLEGAADGVASRGAPARESPTCGRMESLDQTCLKPKTSRDITTRGGYSPVKMIVVGNHESGSKCCKRCATTANFDSTCPFCQNESRHVLQIVGHFQPRKLRPRA